MEGKDSWCNDGFDYTLTPSIDKTNRDSDEDGFVDTDDDCVDLVGSSTNDRNGCTDSDGDGWSDGEDGSNEGEEQPAVALGRRLNGVQTCDYRVLHRARTVHSAARGQAHSTALVVHHLVCEVGKP